MTVLFYYSHSYGVSQVTYIICALIFFCSYRIRQLTEKELAVEVSKEVKKTRYYEYTLIRSYKVLF